MKAVAPHDRPREKLERLGPSGLGDNELLTLVLGQESRTATSLELANSILVKAGGAGGLTRRSTDELRQVPGVGLARASQIVAAVELGRRTLVRHVPPRTRFASPREVAAFLIPQFGSRAVEQFGIVLLDTKHRLLRASVLSVGTLDVSLVHPREVFRAAAAGGAAVIVLFHNHPSGDPTPSRDDELLTRRLVRAGELMGINVLDHLILADVRYFSFKEMARLS